MTNIDQLAARLAKLPRPEWGITWTEIDWLGMWADMLQNAITLHECDMLDAATSYPVVKPEDVRRGEWYWVCVAGGSILWTTWYATSNDVELLGSEFESIRGPISRPE